MATQSARIVGTRLILGTATDLAERNLAKRREIHEQLDNAFRALFEMAKTDHSPELGQAMVHAGRALNSLSEVC